MTNPLQDLKVSHERLYREIAERIQADQTVEQLRRRNELILNSAGEGILGLDREGRHTFVNPAATGMLGYMADELKGTTFKIYLPRFEPETAQVPSEKAVCKQPTGA